MNIPHVDHPYQVQPLAWNSAKIPDPGTKDPRNSNGPAWN